VIDAVEAYLTEWAYIGQNLTTVDWNTIYEVAKEPQATGVLQVWQRWNHQGWHLVGAPVFTPASVAATMTDSLGSYYSVRGCFSVENSHPADAGGVPVIDDEQRKRGVLTYEVVLTWDGLYRVTDSHSEEESC
jgi:hypothetical protein